MSKFADKLINLFEVKKIIALMIITVFCILSAKGDIAEEQFAYCGNNDRIILFWKIYRKGSN